MLITLILLVLAQSHSIPNDVTAIEKQVAYVDSLIKSDPMGFLTFAKLEGTNELTLVQDKNSWPETTTNSYNVYVDPNGNPRYLLESPVSESGDWSVTYRHYFDPKGRTIHFEYYTSFFNSECTEILRERKAYYYSPSFRILHKTEQLMDKDFTPIDRNGCVFNYNFEYTIYKNSKAIPAYLRKAIKSFGRAAP